MKRRIIFLIAGLIFISHLVKAQTPNQARLNTYKIAFLTRKLNLTSSEAEKFWPVYNEFQDKKMQIQQERIGLNRKFNQEGSKMTDEQLLTLGDKLIELEVTETELSMKFHQVLKGLLPPVKILRLYQAEAQFRQQLLNELQDRREQRLNPNQPEPPPGRD